MKAMFILFCISFAGAVSGAESKEIAIEQRRFLRYATR